MTADEVMKITQALDNGYPLTNDLATKLFVECMRLGDDCSILAQYIYSITNPGNLPATVRKAVVRGHQS